MCALYHEVQVWNLLSIIYNYCNINIITKR
jgi:hypothetical protein